MVRQTGIDGYIITAGSYAGPASMDTSSLRDGTPGWQWYNTVTAIRYAEPTVEKYHHRRRVTGGDKGHQSSLTYTNGGQNRR
jgi:hypothetical protein